MTSAFSVLWSLRHSSGRTAHAILVSGGARLRLLWFLDNELEGAEEFQAPDEARRRAEELRLLLTIGLKNS
jgi:hypothetical protein